jgi:hypothetical protein
MNNYSISNIIKRQHRCLPAVCVFLLLAAITSCHKVINVNLNSASPAYIIAGNVTNTPGPYLVTITQSVNFSQDNVAPPVSGATVVITDVTASITDTLTESPAGSYTTHILPGTPGHTYNLYVKAGSNVFTATSTMPQPILLDTLYTEASPFGGYTHPDLVPQYTDPVLTGHNYHYYHFVEYVNDTASTNVIVREDNLLNNQVIKQPINGNELIIGDSVALYMECIDSGAYAFYTSLEQTEDQNSATPANPLTNINGGALGYFSAHTESLKTLIVQ